MKKKIVIIVVCIVIIMVIGLTQFLFPIGASDDIKVTVTIGDATYEYINNQKDEFEKSQGENKEDEGDHWISFRGKLPSENVQDYADLRIAIPIRNISLIDTYKINASVTDIDDKYKSNVMIVTDASSPIIEEVGPVSTGECTVSLIIYRKDMSDEDIQQLVNSLKISYVYYGKYTGVKNESKLIRCYDSIKFVNDLE